MKTILISGSRDWESKEIIYNKLMNCIVRFDIDADPQKQLYYGEEIRVIHGGAKGTDAIAKDCAESFGLPTIEVPADWNKYGRKAGPMRNIQMLQNYSPSILLAFPKISSVGTIHCINEAIKRMVPIEIHYEYSK